MNVLGLYWNQPVHPCVHRCMCLCTKTSFSLSAGRDIKSHLVTAPSLQAKDTKIVCSNKQSGVSILGLRRCDSSGF